MRCSGAASGGHRFVEPLLVRKARALHTVREVAQRGPPQRTDTKGREVGRATGAGEGHAQLCVVVGEDAVMFGRVHAACFSPQFLKGMMTDLIENGELETPDEFTLVGEVVRPGEFREFCAPESVVVDQGEGCPEFCRGRVREHTQDFIGGWNPGVGGALVDRAAHSPHGVSEQQPLVDQLGVDDAHAAEACLDGRIGGRGVVEVQSSVLEQPVLEVLWGVEQVDALLVGGLEQGNQAGYGAALTFGFPPADQGSEGVEVGIHHGSCEFQGAFVGRMRHEPTLGEKNHRFYKKSDSRSPTRDYGMSFLLTLQLRLRLQDADPHAAKNPEKKRREGGRKRGRKPFSFSLKNSSAVTPSHSTLSSCVPFIPTFYERPGAPSEPQRA